MSLNAGQIAAIQGAFCSYGSSASDKCRVGLNAYPGGCDTGNDPNVIPYCPDGATATANCYTLGGTAGQSCRIGNNPGW